MIYRKYFQEADFSTVWDYLFGFYNEPLDTKPLYEAVFYEVRTMPIDYAKSDERIEILVSADNKVKVNGVPDPQEWLIGREVVIEYYNESRHTSDVNTLTAHLLYWSTLYGIKTQKMQAEGFRKWLENSGKGPYYTFLDNDFENKYEAVMLKYIFLDIDGVLNAEQYQVQLAIEGSPTSDEYGPLFDPKSVARLAEIVESSKAEIVMTSSWQNIHSVDKLRAMWKKRGLPGEIRIYSKQDNEKVSNEDVVTAFLRCKTYVPYVILDDENRYPEEYQDNFIQINPITGINAKDVSKAINLLNIYDDSPECLFRDTAYEEECERIGKINAESCARKKLLYWESTIIDDEAYDWSFNLSLLRKKLEYNIGYYRFTQRFVGWERAIAQMVLCYNLINIILGKDEDVPDIYINVSNHARFQDEPTSFEKDNPDFYNTWKRELRETKAYKLLWAVIDRHMKSWWD